MTSGIWNPYRDLDKRHPISVRVAIENMPIASTSVRSFTVLTEDDGVPGSKFERDPENYTVEQLSRWLKCRGLKQSGKREELLGRVRDCIKSGDHRTLDSRQATHFRFLFFHCRNFIL